jgi:hypothetical protein
MKQKQIQKACPPEVGIAKILCYIWIVTIAVTAIPLQLAKRTTTYFRHAMVSASLP